MDSFVTAIFQSWLDGPDFWYLTDNIVISVNWTIGDYCRGNIALCTLVGELCHECGNSRFFRNVNYLTTRLHPFYIPEDCLFTAAWSPRVASWSDYTRGFRADNSRRIIFGTNANKFRDGKGMAGQQTISAQLGAFFPLPQNLPSSGLNLNPSPLLLHLPES